VTLPSTATFNLQVDDLIEEAHALAGGAASTGWELGSARRSLALLMQELTLRGTNLWQVELATTNLTINTPSVTLDADTIDIFKDEITVRDTAASPALDSRVERVARATYHEIANKLQTGGPPSQCFLDRALTAPVLYVYPSPSLSTYQLRYWRVKKPRDVTALTVDVDAPAKWYSAIVDMLAYRLAKKREKEVPIERLQLLKADADESYRIAAGEGVDRADLTLEVDLSCYSGV
jgi:hypothetical protein